MELDVRIVNPAGNITAFVYNDIKQKDYKEIANKLMAIKEYHIEQVAFIKSIDHKPYNMEMMGLEFCGNATRCFGYLVKLHNNLGSDYVDVKVSGVNNLVRVECKDNKAYVIIEDKLIIKELVYDNKILPIVCMNGINHLIIEDIKEFNKVTNDLLKIMKEHYDNDAIGLMYVKDNSMIPIVYVKETNSIVYESSCGSGSMAYAYYKSKLVNKDSYDMMVENPKGNIEVSIKNNNDITLIKMGSIIDISDMIKINI